MKDFTAIIAHKINNYKNLMDIKELITRDFTKISNAISNIPDEDYDWEYMANGIKLKNTSWEQNLYQTRQVEFDSRQKIVLIGESVAQGYGCAPFISISKILELNNPEYQIIDLTRVSLQFKDILRYQSILERIKPHKIIVFAGNNFSTRHHTPQLLHGLHNPMGIEVFFKELYADYVIKPMLNKMKTWRCFEALHFIVPVANPIASKPLNIFAIDDKALECSENALKSKSPDEIQKWLMQNPLCPLANFHLGETYLDLEENEKALFYLFRAHFLQVEKSRGLPGITNSFREAFEEQLMDLNLPMISTFDLFKRDLRRYLADYCHHSIEGIKLVSLEIQNKFLCAKENVKEVSLSAEIKNQIEALFTLVNLRNESYGMLNSHSPVMVGDLNVLDLFNNQPLILNNTFIELCRLENFLPALSHLDYKVIWPSPSHNPFVKQYEFGWGFKPNLPLNLLNPNNAFFRSRRKNIKDYKYNFTKGIYGPRFTFLYQSNSSEFKINVLLQSFVPASAFVLRVNKQTFDLPLVNNFSEKVISLKLQAENIFEIKLKDFVFDYKPLEIYESNTRDPNTFQMKFFEILRFDLINL